MLRMKSLVVVLSLVVLYASAQSSCSSGQYFNGSSCVAISRCNSVCASGTSFYGSCSCTASCQVCDVAGNGQTLCSLCAAGTYLYRGSCVRTCPVGTTPQGTGSLGRLCVEPPDTPPLPSISLQYELQAPTATSDRVCANVTACTPGSQWQRAEPTATSNRVCQSLTLCGEEQYYVALSDGFSDNVCGNATQCVLGRTYEVQALTATSDRRCADVSPAACRARCDNTFLSPARAWNDSFTACSCDISQCAACAGPLTASGPTLVISGTCYRCRPPFFLDLLRGACVANCSAVSSDTGPQAYGTVCYNTSVTLSDIQALLPNLQPEFESAAPTLQSNRRCSTVSFCNVPSEYVSQSATWTSDTVCANVSSCGSGRYVGVNATASSDVQCRTCSGCGTNEFESAPCSVYRNVECSACTACQAHQYQASACTVSSDTRCLNCTTCPTNTFITASCSPTSDTACRDCSVCEAGKYNTAACRSDNDTQCTSCSACQSNEYESLPCTPSSNRRCQPVQACQTGTQFQFTAPTATSDRVCRNITQCRPGLEYELQRPTATSDRRCGNVSVCTAKNSYEAVRPTLTSDRLCLNCSQCLESDVFMAASCTPTSDTVCQRISSCQQRCWFSTDAQLCLDQYDQPPCSAYFSEATCPSDRCRYDRFSLTGCQPRTASYVPFGVPNRCPYLQRAECNGSCTWDFVAAVCRLRACDDEPTKTSCETMLGCTWNSSFSYCLSPGQLEIPCHRYYNAMQCSADRRCYFDTTISACYVNGTQPPCEAYSALGAAACPRDRCRYSADAILCHDKTTNPPCSRFSTATTCPSAGREYLTAYATATTDTLCRRVRVCNTSFEYLSKPASVLTDAVCSNLSVCNADQYQSKAPTATSDRSCSNVRTCNYPQEYRLTAATATSNAICATPKSCLFDTYFDMDGNLTALLQYRQGYLQGSANSSLAPSYESKPLTLTSDRQCSPITLCALNAFQSVPPTPTSDARCITISSCPPDTFEYDGPTYTSDRVCWNRTSCDAYNGEFEYAPATTTSDAQCRNTTRCNETTFQSLQATATRDRNCTRLAECTLGQSYEIQAPFRASGNLARFVVYTSNRVCSPVRACLSGAEYQLQAATLTSNAVCRAFTACNASQIEVVPATATSDRVCFEQVRAIASLYFTNIEPGNFSIGVFVMAIQQVVLDRTLWNVSRSQITIDKLQFGSVYIAFGVTVPAFSFNDTLAAITDGSLVLGYLQALAPSVFANVSVAPLQCGSSGYVGYENGSYGSQRAVCLPATTCTAQEYQVVPLSRDEDRQCLPLTDCIAGTTFEAFAPTATSDRLCANVTQCNVTTEYQAAPPSLTADRACKLLRECVPEAEFETVAPTSTSQRQCQNATVCDPSREFETRPLTATSDRLCEALTLCTVSEYQDKAPTATSDRSCAPLSSCQSNQFEEQPPTLTSDRVCSNYTTCSPALEYQTRAPTLFSDRQCQQLTVCNAFTEYQSRRPTATSDRNCSSLTLCQGDEFQSFPPTPTTDRRCSRVTDCVPGSFQTAPLTFTSDRQCNFCSVCNTSTHYQLAPCSDSVDTQCLPLTVCAANTFIAINATPTSDRFCDSCTSCPTNSRVLKACSLYSDTQCSGCSSCVANSSYVSQPCTASSNTVCKACSNCTAGSTYRTRPCTTLNDTQCAPCRTCAPGLYIASACTVSADTLCHNISSCNFSDSFQAAAATATSDTVCRPFSTCGAQSYERAPPTATTDRLCLALRVCDAEREYEVEAATSTSDRTCTELTECLSPGQFQWRPPTATSDRACNVTRTCLPGQFQAAAPTLTTDRQCQNCSKAPADSFLTQPCTAAADASYEPCRQCGALEYETQACTINGNRECQLLTTCSPLSQYESQRPTATSNRACAFLTPPCGGNSYETRAATPTSDRTCSVARQCSVHQFQTQPLTATSNRECQNLTACKVVTGFMTNLCSACESGFSGESSVASSCAAALQQACTSQTDLPLGTVGPSHCGTCLAQPPSNSLASSQACISAGLIWARPFCRGSALEYIATGATITSDRQCAPLTACTSSQLVVSQPTPTSNRLCGTSTTAATGTTSAGPILTTVATANAQGATSATADVHPGLYAGVAAAGVLLLLVLIFGLIRQQRKGQAAIHAASEDSAAETGAGTGMGTGKATMFAAYSQGTLSAEEAYEMELERLAAGGDVVDEPIKPQGRASPASTTGSSPNKKQSRGKQAGADRRRISDPIPVGSDFDNPWDAMGLAKTQETVVDDADAERADAAFKGAAAYQDWKNMKVGDKRRSQQRISNDSTGTTAAGKSSSHSSKVAPASTLPASSQPRSAWASTTSSPEPLADVRHSSFARPLGDDTKTGPPSTARYQVFGAGGDDGDGPTRIVDVKSLLPAVKSPAPSSSKSSVSQQKGAAETNSPAPKAALQSQTGPSSQPKESMAKDHDAQPGNSQSTSSPAEPKKSAAVAAIDESAGALAGASAPPGDARDRSGLLEGLKRGLASAEDNFEPPDPNSTTRDASVGADFSNSKKNRDAKVLPMDSTRVRLKERPAALDYLNANFVSFPDAPAPRRYVVAQGPLPNTVDDFWLAVAQERPPAVVMLTKAFEKGKPMSAAYIPASKGSQNQYGTVNVVNLGVDKSAHMTVTVLQVQPAAGREFVTTHIHLTSWPLDGVPTDSNTLLALRRKVTDCMAAGPAEGADGPTFVHCDLGLNRSGAFILLDIMMAKLDKGLIPDAAAILAHLRNQRHGLINTLQLFRYCYESCLAALST